MQGHSRNMGGDGGVEGEHGERDVEWDSEVGCGEYTTRGVGGDWGGRMESGGVHERG